MFEFCCFRLNVVSILIIRPLLCIMDAWCFVWGFDFSLLPIGVLNDFFVITARRSARPATDTTTSSTTARAEATGATRTAAFLVVIRLVASFALWSQREISLLSNNYQLPTQRLFIDKRRKQPCRALTPLASPSTPDWLPSVSERGRRALRRKYRR